MLSQIKALIKSNKYPRDTKFINISSEMYTINHIDLVCKIQFIKVNTNYVGFLRDKAKAATGDAVLIRVWFKPSSLTKF